MTVRKSERGFTLVDTMVALAVLAVGMAGVGTMLHDSVRTNLFSVSDRNADGVAQEITEDLKGQLAQGRFNDIENVTLTNPKFNPPVYKDAGQTGAGINYVDRRGMWGGYVYQWRVEQQRNIDNTGVEPMTRLLVIVAYDSVPSAVASFPRDPGDPNFWRFKTRIINFVMTR